MKLAGKTPLLRAINLEKKLNVKRIYLKLEGANPTHHKYARIAEVLCKDAIAHNKRTILVDGTNAYIRAVEFFANKNDLTIVIPRFRHETWKKYRFEDQEILDLRNKKRHERFELTKSIAQTNNYYLAVEGYTNKHISLMALEELSLEIIQRRNEINTVFTQFGVGYTLSSMYNAFLKQWIEEEKPFPKLFCGINNQDRLEYDQLGHDIVSYLHSDETLLESSKRALKESYGKTVVVDEEDLKQANRLLRDKEHIKLTTENAYPMAAFIKLVKQGRIKEGVHIIVLDDARSRIDIELVKDFKKYSKSEILSYAKTYLAEYSDPLIEMQDAVNNASDKGYIFIAKRNEENLGVCIVVNTQFETFIPTYHLAYIGTNKTYKSRGIGTELIKRAVDVTNGKLSLHVDLDNKKAKKLYEKMGFKHMYNRMIYYGE